MKAVKSNIYRKVRVVLNTERPDRHSGQRSWLMGKLPTLAKSPIFAGLPKRGITSCLLCKPPSFGPHPLGGGGFLLHTLY